MTNKRDRAKNLKLPPRYPRDSEIVIFNSMDELDSRLSYLDDLEETLNSISADLDIETVELKWKEYTKADLRHFYSVLRKAYLEYERFYQPEGWTINDDSLLNDDLNDAGDFYWRVEVFRQGRLIDIPEKVIKGSKNVVPAKVSRLYEPSQHACAEAIFLILFLMESCTDSQHLNDIFIRLRYWFVRYYAATLEVTHHRGSVYLSSIEHYISSAEKSQKAAQENADASKAKAYVLSVSLAKRVHELHTSNISKTHAVSKVSVEHSVSKSRVWQALKITKNHSRQA